MRMQALMDAGAGECRYFTVTGYPSQERADGQTVADAVKG
jgi:hypothetical protein